MKINKKLIKELVSCLEENKLSELEYSEKDIKIKVVRNSINDNSKIQVVQNTNEIKPSVLGHYLVTFVASASTAGASGYTPISYIYKNTSSWFARAGIRGYAGSSTIDFPSNTTIVSIDSSTEYFKFAVYQNQGGTATGSYGTATIVRIGD